MRIRNPKTAPGGNRSLATQMALLIALSPIAACSSGGGGTDVTAGFQAGDTLPGYAHVIPRGSRADVQAKGQHSNGQWTVEIRRLLDTGHSDDARLEVGENTVFSIAVTDNSGGTHNGAGIVDLTWQGTPNQQNVVVGDLAALGQSAPVIDGDAGDAAWSAVPTSVIQIFPMSGDNGVTSVTMQAAQLDGFVYFRASWSDAAPHVRRKEWTYDGTSWSRNSDNEDRLFLMFDISDAMGTAVPGSGSGTTTTFSQMGCTIACHGDGTMRLDAGRADMWHWKSTRTDPAGYLDDKYIVAAASGQDGRKSDQGLAAYVSNKNAAGTEPGWRSARGYNANPDFLFLLPEDHDFAEARSGNSGFAVGDMLPGYVQRIPENSRADVTTRGRFEDGKWTVEFSRALDTGSTWERGSPVRFREGALWKAGATIPGYVTVPPLGSFGDVEAMGQWSSGVWTLEISRDLDTGNPDDVVFVPTDPMAMSVGITNNSGGTHNGVPSVNLDWQGLAGPTTVVAELLGTSSPPTIDGDGSDAAWGSTQLSDVALTPQSGSNGINSVQIQALRSATKIYFKFVWADSTRNDIREQWTHNAGIWSQNSENEDRLFVMFDIDGALGTGTSGADDGVGNTPFSGGTQGGCTVLCHGDGVMRTSSGSVDTWHWKATRNNGSGWLDDKFADFSDRHKDDGAGLGTRNRNGARTLPNYQSFRDSGANVAHLPFTTKSGPDDAAFVVGYKMPFALGLTDSSGHFHDGAPLLQFEWSGTSTPTKLVAVDLAGTSASRPAIDGFATDAAWALASPANVVITPQSGGGFGIAGAELRAVYDADHVYVLVVWDDPSFTRNILKNRRLFNGASWSTSGAQDEDRVFFLWSMDEALGTATPGQTDGTTTSFRAAGCTITCHGDDKMRTASGRLDTWHWKAARTNGLGYTDDKYFTAAALNVSGRKGDFGRSSQFSNGTADTPEFRAYGGPGSNVSYLMVRPVSGAHRALSLVPAVNVPPQANAGPDQNVLINAAVTLDGSASFDPNPGDAITLSWVQTGGTAVTLSGANTATPSFTAPNADATLTFELTVSDGDLQDVDSTTVTVLTAPVTQFYAADIHPIWVARGCVTCHTPSAPMDLSGTASATWPVLMAGRVDTNTPESSLILTKPLAIGAGGAIHGGGEAFATTNDADYQKILLWIEQGAQNN